MIISTDKIDQLCKGKPPLIEPYCPADNKNNPARAQLHLGKLCYCSNTPEQIHDLEAEGEIVIAPNTIFLFETYEKVNFPRDLSGRMSLKMGLIQQGLLMPNQTQVDPGYSNVLFGMLYNLSSAPVKLAYRQAITTLEITKTECSKRNYAGKMKSITFDEYVRNRVVSSLGYLDDRLQTSNAELQKSTERLNQSVEFWNRILTSFAVALAVISVLVAVMSFKSDPDIETLKYRADALQETVAAQQEQLAEYEGRLRELEDMLPAAGASGEAVPAERAGEELPEAG